MKKKFFKFLKIFFPIAIGVYLTWYFFKGLSKEELQQTKDAFFDADYVWVILSLIVAFLSHLSRAYRWRFLLDPLGYKPSLGNAYHAVMSGYVINFTVPRSGEFARAGLLSSAENVPYEKSFATIVVERVIDVLMLGGVVFITGLMQANSEEFEQITRSGVDKEENAWLLYAIIAASLVAIVLLFIYFKITKFRLFVREKIKGFWEGLKSIWTMKKKWWFLFHTIFIWVCYVAGIWITAQAFPETRDMPIECVFGAFVVGAAAIAVLPGGMGAYPNWINAVLVLYGIQYAGYSIFMWVVQTALLVVLGLVSLLIIQKRIKTPGKNG